MKTILLTGATRGLGLAFAQQLAARADVALVLGVRDLAAGQTLAAELGPNVRAIALDMGSRASVQQLVAQWDGPLYALINNAGLQQTGPTVFSADGVEMTLAVNHLGPLELTLGLLPWLGGGTVLGIGSGTHNPNDRLARLFGFRGGRFTSIAALALGETDAGSDRQAGMDRYATSKLAFMASAAELGRRHHSTRFVTLDPGLMPGTGLVRSAPAPIRWAWARVLPKLVPLVPGASTPQRSAKAGIDLLFDPTTQSGQVYNFNATLSQDVWDPVFEPAFGRKVLDQSFQQLEVKRAA